ncbi:hypothetical protein OZX69_07790 [Lactobacillus sp. ESL0731]|uniref:hypothetical protein n=1 Tax=unclassified Lactobacillus TaxID=2620435 RepID=UPI0023F932C0|nr:MULTISPECIES: hypothetical protein [unclassified Lactobacillus]WEV50842.1 hypothetical protein OZX63_07785 [Lactobacillus sp. ESL0700]WEV61973.1 hypothetical protein OZX69_07790 [Lactobacillus sp. ESL0731]
MSDFDKIVQDFFKNYQDRGMKKWTGFFLSDHTMMINKDRDKRSVRHPCKRTLTQEEIGSRLLEAYSNHQLVRVQVKIVDENDRMPADIVGFVSGYYEDKIIIANQSVALADINNIELKWKNLI